MVKNVVTGKENEPLPDDFIQDINGALNDVTYVLRRLNPLDPIPYIKIDMYGHLILDGYFTPEQISLVSSVYANLLLILTRGKYSYLLKGEKSG